MVIRMDAEKAARRVKILNKVLGMPQEAIANRLGVAFSTVNGWHTGKSKPRAASIEALEQAIEEETREPSADREVHLRQILAVLEDRYGSPRLGNKLDPLDELFFILLSLKATHTTYEDLYDDLARRFRPWKKLLDASPEDVEQVVRKGGLGSIKAKAFIKIAIRLQEDFGKVTLSPLKKWDSTKVENYLCSLPGVGIKTARCVMLYALEFDTVPVDTHTYRVGARLQIIPSARTPTGAHQSFDSATPSGLAYCLHTNFVALGREFCRDVAPKCGECPIRRLCPSAQPTTVSGGRQAAAPFSASREITVADIYAGCGGLSLGARLAGTNVAYSLDWDRHACLTHERNFPGGVNECEDVRAVPADRIASATGGQVDILIGGPNCQGVSERGLRSPDDPRNFMFPEFVRLVDSLRPRAFLMENVPGLSHRHNFSLLKDIFASFDSLGYRCSADVLLAADYGVPQLRYRFFLLGTLEEWTPTFPAPTHGQAASDGLFSRPYVTVGEAIGDLPEVDAYWQDPTPLPYPGRAENDYQRLMREGSSEVHNHICSATDEINLRRASYIPEGGNWKDIPANLLPDRFFKCRMTDHSTTYARLRRDCPAFTITSLFGNITSGAFTHPTITRALTVREGARLQSFPDSFVFCGPRNSQYRQIGNAVPPLLGKAVVGHLAKQLRGERAPSIDGRIGSDILDAAFRRDDLPVLTPRFKKLFGLGTRWPKGWGAEPEKWTTHLDKDYRLTAKRQEAVGAA